MSNVKIRVSIYSNDAILNPQAYYDKVFDLHKRYWRLVDSENVNCIIVESNYVYPNDASLQRTYERYTPEMYDSTKMTLVPVL